MFLTNHVWGNRNSLAGIDLLVKQWACLLGNRNLRTRGEEKSAQCYYCFPTQFCKFLIFYYHFGSFPASVQANRPWHPSLNITCSNFLKQTWCLTPHLLHAGGSSMPGGALWGRKSCDCLGPNINHRPGGQETAAVNVAEERNRLRCLKITLFHIIKHSTEDCLRITNVICGPQIGQSGGTGR